MNIFDYLKDIITTKSGGLQEHTDFPNIKTFMVCRWLSMDTRFVHVATEANRLQPFLTQEQMYKYLIKTIPYYRSSFIKYIKKASKK